MSTARSSPPRPCPRQRRREGCSGPWRGLLQVEHRVHNVYEFAQLLAEHAQPGRPERVRGLVDEELAHERAEAFRPGVGVRLAAALYPGELREARFDEGALFRIGLPAALILRAHHGGLGPAEEPALVAPVVQAVLIGEDEVHVGGVFGDGARAPAVLVQRMGGAALAALPELGLVHALQEQHEEGHVVGQREAGEGAVPLLERAAQPAVAALVSRELFRAEGIRVRYDVSEHQVFLMKELPHLRQTMRIFPLPRGTRSSVRHWGQRKNL